MKSAAVLRLAGFLSLLHSFEAEGFLITPSTSSTCRIQDVNTQAPICPFAPSTRYRAPPIGSRTKRTRSSVASEATRAIDTIVAPPAALELQAELRRLTAGTGNGVKANSEQRKVIERLAQELVALNPFENPAFSPLLAGRWRVLYTTVPGPSSGRLGPFVGDVLQEIRPEEKRIFNILELGPSWALRGALEADIEVLDGKNWAITFDVVYNNFAGIRVQEKKFDPALMERRIWTMSYLDEGFRVVYGRQESMPASEGYLFIIEREREESSNA